MSANYRSKICKKGAKNAIRERERKLYINSFDDLTILVTLIVTPYWRCSKSRHDLSPYFLQHVDQTTHYFRKDCGEVKNGKVMFTFDE